MLPFPSLYIKLAGAAIVLVIIGSAYWWIKSAFTERDKLRISYAEKAIQVQQYQESIARDIKLREGINDAVSKIRVTSNNYIKQVDGQPSTNLPDGTVVQLVASGLLVGSPSLSTFTNASTSGRSAIVEAR